MRSPMVMSPVASRLAAASASRSEPSRRFGIEPPVAAGGLALARLSSVMWFSSASAAGPSLSHGRTLEFQLHAAELDHVAVGEQRPRRSRTVD